MGGDEQLLWTGTLSGVPPSVKAEAAKKIDSILIAAAKNGDNNVVLSLLKNSNPTDANAISERHAALCEACWAGHLDVTKSLVEAGANADLDTKRSETALYAAVHRGHLALVRYLIEQSADAKRYVNMDDKEVLGLPILHVAAEKDNLDIVRLLVDVGADLKMRNQFGLTAAQYACSESQFEVMRIILDKDPERLNDQDEDLTTCLHLAAEADRADDVWWLLDRGAKADTRDRTGMTAWDITCGNVGSRKRRAGKFNAMSIFATKGLHNTGFAVLDETIRPDSYLCTFNHNNRLLICAFVRDVSKSYASIRESLPLVFAFMAREFLEIREFSEAKVSDISDSRRPGSEFQYAQEAPLNFLRYREPSCNFEILREQQSTVHSDASSTGRNMLAGDDLEFGGDNRRGSDYVSLVMPYLDSRSWKFVQERAKEYEKLTHYPSPCITDFKETFGVYLPLTLDEYCKLVLPKNVLDAANKDQVLARWEMKKRGLAIGQELPDDVQLLTVHQVWLWKIHNVVLNTGREVLQDGSSLHLSLAPKDSFERIALILSHLVNIVERPETANLQESFLHTFEKSIVNVAEDVSAYLKDMEVSKISIEAEKGYLHNISDIREELAMIQLVLTQQEEVWREFMSNAWPELWPSGTNGRMTTPLDLEYFSRDRREVWRLIMRPQSQFQKYRRQIDRLNEDATRVEASIITKLDLKQKHASLREAHTAAVMSAMVFGFTIITIVFTPLSFIVGLFALPINHLQASQEPSRWHNQGGSYSANYIGTYAVTTEIVSIAVTAIAMWVAVEVGMGGPVARKINAWRKKRSIDSFGTATTAANQPYYVLENESTSKWSRRLSKPKEQKDVELGELKS